MGTQSTPTRKYMRQALDAVKEYLDDTLPAKIEVIRGERDFTVRDVPNLNNTTTKPTHKELYPRIEILPDRTEHDYSFPDQPLVKPILFHTIVLWITHRAGDIETVKRVLEVYVEAVNRVQEDDDSFGNEFTWVQLRDEDWSVMIEAERERAAFLQMVSIELNARTL